MAKRCTGRVGEVITMLPDLMTCCKSSGDILILDDGYVWRGGDVIRTTYDMLLYGLDGVECDPPLGPGDPVRVGPYRLRVLAEEPERATVLLARGSLLGYWLARFRLWLAARLLEPSLGEPDWEYLRRAVLERGMEE
jgi:hypothetical protein